MQHACQHFYHSLDKDIAMPHHADMKKGQTLREAVAQRVQRSILVRQERAKGKTLQEIADEHFDGISRQAVSSLERRRTKIESKLSPGGAPNISVDHAESAPLGG